jgi:hypothetical protein
MSYHHKPIKRFELEGTIHDDALIDRLKTEYIALLVLGMRADGYVPRYDVDNDFTLEYTGDGYKFELSVYGSFVGKKRSQTISGMDGYHPRLAPTHILTLG